MRQVVGLIKELVFYSLLVALSGVFLVVAVYAVSIAVLVTYAILVTN